MPTPLIANAEYCRYCGHPVGKMWPHGARQGYRYSDGRLICELCHQIAVKDDAALLQSWRYTVQACIDLGMDAHWGDVKVRLRQRPELKVMSMSGGDGVVGLARSLRCGKVVESDITILYGMPLAHVVNTLAHEAGHVWCHEHEVEFSPAEVEEGFCNVVACLVVRQLPPHLNPQDRVDALFADPHPVYGLRFRQEWAKVQHRTWPGYLRDIH